MTRWVAWSLLAVMLLVMALSGVLVFTEAGLQWVARELPRWVPGQLTLGQARGRLSGPLEFENLRYEYGDVLVVVEHIALDWSPQHLLREVLHVDVLAARGVHVRTAGNSAGAPGALPAVVLPLAVELPSASIEDISLDLDGDEPLRLDRIDIAAAARGSNLNVDRLDIRAPNVSLQASGDLEARDRYPLSVVLGWQAVLAPEMRGAGRGELRGDLDTLQIKHRSSAPLISEFEGSISGLMAVLSWQGHLRTSPVRLNVLLGDLPAWTLGVDLDLSGSLDSVRGAGSVLAELPEIGPLAGEVDVTYEANTVRVARLDAVSDVGRAQVTGTIDLAADHPTAAMVGQWQNARWPAGEGDAQFRSSRGRIELSGARVGARVLRVERRRAIGLAPWL